MASTIKLQDLVLTAQAYAELTPVLGVAGKTQRPAIDIGNDTMQKFLAEPFDWKWNRGNYPPFLTVALQQDYIGSVTNLSWLESATWTDINNTSIPKPTYGMEAVRDLPITFQQSQPFQICWIPNALATYGLWQANTLYPTGLGTAATPASPIQQFIDANGNFLYVTAYGTSGNVQPVLPQNSVAGATVVDNQVTWTVADPNGVAMRLTPLPATSNLTWQIQPIYQKKPPILTGLANVMSPIPDELGYLLRQGFLAMCYGHAASPKFRDAFAMWQEDLRTAVESGDREEESYGMYPSESIGGGGPNNGWPYSIGPAYPFQPYAY